MFFKKCGQYFMLHKVVKDMEILHSFKTEFQYTLEAKEDLAKADLHFFTSHSLLMFVAISSSLS